MPPQGDQPVNETKEVQSTPAAEAERGATARLQAEATDSSIGGTSADDSNSDSLNFAGNDSNSENLKEGDTLTETGENLHDDIDGADYELLNERIAKLKGEKPEVKDGKVDCPDCMQAAESGENPLKGAPNELPEIAALNADQNISDGQYEKFGKLASAGSVTEARANEVAEGDSNPERPDESSSRDAGDRGIPQIQEVSVTGDRAPEGSAQRIRDGGDGNVVREYDESTDSESEVKRKFSEMARESHGGNAEEMIRSFNKSFDTMNENLSPEQMQEVRRNMSVMMENGNMSERLTANTVVDHAAKVADAVDGHTDANAFAQGPNPTCALTSQARLEAQQDPVKYSNKAASLVARGGAWTGGENGTPAKWTQIDSSNFRPDAEANESYNATEKQFGGERGMAGKLDDALRGQQMSDNVTADERASGALDSNQSYVYTTGSGQGHEMAKQGTYLRTEGANGAESNEFKFGSPASTLERVAQNNQQEGLGGLLVSESYRGQRGAENLEKYGARFFSGVDGLKAETAKTPGQELQIATNGSMILGRPGHGLHAQTVRSEEGTGDLVFGNNWTGRHNNQKYNDAFVDTFTDPAKSNHARPGDGGGHDGGGQGNGFSDQDWGNNRMDDRDYIDRYKEEQDLEKERLEEKDKKEEEEKEDPEEKKKEDGNDIEAQGRFAQEHARWMQRREAADATDQPFSEKEPVLSDYLGR